MHQKPSMQDLVKATLIVELPLFFTNIFQVIDVRVNGRGQQDSELAEQGCSYGSVCNTDAMASCLFEIRPNLGGQNTPQLRARLLVHLHTRSDGDVPTGTS